MSETSVVLYEPHTTDPEVIAAAGLAAQRWLDSVTLIAPVVLMLLAGQSV